jgi:hypothetical protein
MLPIGAIHRENVATNVHDFAATQHAAQDAVRPGEGVPMVEP